MSWDGISKLLATACDVAGRVDVVDKVAARARADAKRREDKPGRFIVVAVPDRGSASCVCEKG